MTAGSLPTTAGVPAAIVRPKLRTVMLVAEPHHQAHVVLDEHHGQVVVVAQLAHERHQLVDLAVGQSGGRLVEQQQLGPRGDGAGQLDPFQRAVRQPGGRAAGDLGQPDLLQGGVGLGRAPASPRGSTHGARTALLTQSDVRTRWSPTITFSRTVRRGNSARFWNVREICFWATLCGGRPSSSSSFQRMLPDEAR